MARIFSKESLYGYIEINHRDSPGFTRNEAPGVKGNPGGANFVQTPGGTVFQGKTFTCPKCQSVIVKNPDRDRNRGFCRKCDRDLCDRCALLLKLNHTCTVESCWHIRQLTLA